MLWMDLNMPERFDSSVLDKSRLDEGSAVGDLAKGYFGQFIEVPFSQDKSKMTTETQRLLDAGASVIAEASFSYHGNYCNADILRAVQGGYDLIEVKSSANSGCDEPKKVKPIYLEDMAYQLYVLTNCGLSIQKTYIMQLNRDYVRAGELDIQKLFVLTDCTEYAFDMQQGVAANIREIISTAKQREEPDVSIGSRCDNPYECGYKSWCLRTVPHGNVFQIGWGMFGSKKDDAFNSGAVTLQDVFNSGIKLSEKQFRQVATAVQNLPPHINKEAIRAFLSQIKYPLYYLDFETCQQPIPLWDYASPYEPIPFQYSLHMQELPRGKASHREFLGKEGLDPRRALAEQLCADIPMDVCLLAYNMSFEKGRIKALAQLFPDLAWHLMNIHDRIVDLAEPFRSGAYYCREMGGSYSIKAVLPALCPDEPELDYSALNIIHNGSDAQAAYSDLHNRPPDVIAEIRTALLDYCRLDTLAMVRILEKLYSAVSDKAA